MTSRLLRKAGGPWFKIRDVFCACLAVGLLALFGCQSSESEKEYLLKIQNPYLADNLDSLDLFGVNTEGGDTLLIYSWKRGEEFQQEVKYPPGLHPNFVLLVRGYKSNALVYQSHAEVSGNAAKAPMQDFKIAPPELAPGPIRVTSRIRDSVVLRPSWVVRPGIQEQGKGDTAPRFTAQGAYSWRKGDLTLSRDSILVFDSLKLADSGSYLFIAENVVGRDSLQFVLTVKHLIPKINALGNQSAVAGQPFSIQATIVHSDSLLYRWLKGFIVISQDSVLKFSPIKSDHVGSYRLVVKNASDTLEMTASNVFTLGLSQGPVRWNEIVWDHNSWQ